MAILARLRHPQTTVRWRLTLLYGGLFLVCGAALLAITYTLVAHATTSPDTAFIGQSAPAVEMKIEEGSLRLRSGRTASRAAA